MKWTERVNILRAKDGKLYQERVYSTRRDTMRHSVFGLSLPERYQGYPGVWFPQDIAEVGWAECDYETRAHSFPALLAVRGEKDGMPLAWEAESYDEGTSAGLLAAYQAIW